MDANLKPPKRRAHQLRVPVLPDEATEIRRLASAAGLPMAAYLRQVGLGYRVEGILDLQCIEALARINGELERVGGLLMLWLADDPRTIRFGDATIRAVLTRIEDTQNEMQRLMRAVVLPARGRRVL